jgi:hypothetical protein
VCGHDLRTDLLNAVRMNSRENRFAQCCWNE